MFAGAHTALNAPHASVALTPTAAQEVSSIIPSVPAKVQRPLAGGHRAYQRCNFAFVDPFLPKTY